MLSCLCFFSLSFTCSFQFALAWWPIKIRLAAPPPPFPLQRKKKKFAAVFFNWFFVYPPTHLYFPLKSDEFMFALMQGNKINQLGVVGIVGLSSSPFPTINLQQKQWMAMNLIFRSFPLLLIPPFLICWANFREIQGSRKRRGKQSCEKKEQYASEFFEFLSSPLSLPYF